ncbi:MAG: DUF2314 domain-containing protein [Hyphomonas sp.]|nr:DUF2314 domain-containing protein [Hyphomonas sp.]
MRFRNFVSLLILLTGFAFASLPAAAQGSDVIQMNVDGAEPVLGVEEENAAMNAAMAEARRTLPVFWSLFDTYPEKADAFSIKAGFETTTGTLEHIWLADLSHEGDRITGTLNNEPLYLPEGVKRGDVVTVYTRDVSDWTITGNGRKDYGGFTVRVFADLLGGEEGAALRASLKDQTLPPFADPAVVDALPEK